MVNSLTEQELSVWMVRGPLWPRRLEMHLMQIANTIARCNNNKTNMSDFDLFNVSKAVAVEEAANDISIMAGASVRRLGQGRKR